MSIEDNYKHLLQEIHQTCKKCGRNPADISLIAVTKNEGWERIQPLYECGQRDFGESRLQEALQKQAIAPNGCRWHFIGTLQKNKVRKVIGNFVLIHSVDSPELAVKISQCSQELGVTTSILLQANTSGETTKHGQTPDAWISCFKDLLLLPSISIEGLMTMAPLVADDGRIRACFAMLRELRDHLAGMAHGKTNLRHLSMGMTHDFKVAIAEGATLLRIGSAIFTPKSN